MPDRVFKRQRISTQLHRLVDYPLTFVVAGMGYGKTTAVKDYLDENNAKYAWLFMEEDEASPQAIWNSLTKQLARFDPECGTACVKSPLTRL